MDGNTNSLLTQAYLVDFVANSVKCGRCSDVTFNRGCKVLDNYKRDGLTYVEIDLPETDSIRMRKDRRVTVKTIKPGTTVELVDGAGGSLKLVLVGKASIADTPSVYSLKCLIFRLKELVLVDDETV